MRYIVLDGLFPWVRGGCIEWSRGQGRFRCGEDVYPSSHAQRVVEILQNSFFLASLVFWLFLASMFFWDNFVFSSCLCTVWKSCFKCSLTFTPPASFIQDRRFATLQRTLFLYLINKYISLSGICLTVYH